MPDVYATIATAGSAVIEPLVEILELRAADPQQRRMREAYLSEIAFPASARVVEIGCGPGPVARALAAWPGVAEVVGVDPSPIFLDRARELAKDMPNLTFVEGDARDLPLADAAFDVAVFHTVLCHVPVPELALAEAMRVLRPGGVLAVFDGDYNTVSCATAEADPLQACADAAVNSFVHDRWVPRRLPALLRTAGFEHVRLSGHSAVLGASPQAPTSRLPPPRDTCSRSSIGASTPCSPTVASDRTPPPPSRLRPAAAATPASSSATSPTSVPSVTSRSTTNRAHIPPIVLTTGSDRAGPPAMPHRLDRVTLERLLHVGPSKESRDETTKAGGGSGRRHPQHDRHERFRRSTNNRGRDFQRQLREPAG
jgi:SAM-dependent methyltransferase